jgi:hypothetical protein
MRQARSQVIAIASNKLFSPPYLCVPLQFKAALVESQVFLDNGTCPIHSPRSWQIWLTISSALPWDWITSHCRFNCLNCVEAHSHAVASYQAWLTIDRDSYQKRLFQKTKLLPLLRNFSGFSKNGNRLTAYQ